MSHAAAIEDVGEGPLDHLAATAHGLPPDPGFQPHAIGVDRFARRLVAMPAKIPLGGLGLGDPRLPLPAFQNLQLLTGVITFVRDKDAWLFLARRQPDRVEIARGGL